MRNSAAGRIAGIFGWPVAHSRSPLLHGFWLDFYGIDGAYVPLAVAPEHFDRALRILPRLGFVGANVTVPHKEAALEAVDDADELAQKIGAVNTVVVREDGSLHGSNTDAFGFIENLREFVPEWTASSGPAVVVGAGGAARAIAFALVDGGAPEIRIVNRTTARADALADELGPAARTWPWIDRAGSLNEAGLLVNTTKLGMQGEASLDLPLDALPQEAVVTDAVYVPLETALLAEAAERGNRVVDGLGMLLHQARPGFEVWFGVTPVVTEELRAYVEADLKGLPRT
ncbi:MAG: shikimate dehydrogenase [Alphaproteobacteria bacterium]|nr:shikimate dehydrogenase [Alphaproteobacteria bacterium]MCY4497210.1 shikimate dehydrogenase [Rhodospirillaceae bacterium]